MTIPACTRCSDPNGHHRICSRQWRYSLAGDASQLPERCDDSGCSLRAPRSTLKLYDKSFATIGRLAEVVDQQQAFILNTSFMEGRTAEELAQLEAALPAVVGVINTLTRSELASTAGLLNFEGQAFFDTTVSKLAGNTLKSCRSAGW